MLYFGSNNVEHFALRRLSKRYAFRFICRREWVDTTMSVPLIIGAKYMSLSAHVVVPIRFQKHMLSFVFYGPTIVSVFGRRHLRS